MDRNYRPTLLERPANKIGVSCVVFWLAFAGLVIAGHFAVKGLTGAQDRYPWVIVIGGVALAWIAIEIVWSYRGLLSLAHIIETLASKSQADASAAWFVERVEDIYSPKHMAISGIPVFLVFGALTVYFKTACWSDSVVLCWYDSAVALFIFFLGGMSQWPFWGMSDLIFRLPTRSIDHINLFSHPRSNIMRVGSFLLKVGLGGVGLIILSEVLIYYAPIGESRIYYQLVFVAISLATLVWFLLTQKNIHRVMADQKRKQLDQVSNTLFQMVERASQDPTEDDYYKVFVLTTLRREISGLPEWPFDLKGLLSLASATFGGAVVPLVRIISNGLSIPW
jgi:hypothetical protein